MPSLVPLFRISCACYQIMLQLMQPSRRKGHGRFGRLKQPNGAAPSPDQFFPLRPTRFATQFVKAAGHFFPAPGWSHATCLVDHASFCCVSFSDACRIKQGTSRTVESLAAVPLDRRQSVAAKTCWPCLLADAGTRSFVRDGGQVSAWRSSGKAEFSRSTIP